MSEEKKNITCFECGKDFSVEAIAEANGRCPECGFNIQLHRDLSRSEAVRSKEKKDEKSPAKTPKKLYGF